MNAAALLSEFLRLREDYHHQRVGLVSAECHLKVMFFLLHLIYSWCKKCPCPAHISDFLLDSSAGGAGFKGHHEAGEMVFTKSVYSCSDHSDTFHFTLLHFPSL